VRADRGVHAREHEHEQREHAHAADHPWKGSAQPSRAVRPRAARAGRLLPRRASPFDRPCVCARARACVRVCRVGGGGYWSGKAAEECLLLPFVAERGGDAVGSESPPAASSTPSSQNKRATSAPAARLRSAVSRSGCDAYGRRAEAETQMCTSTWSRESFSVAHKAVSTLATLAAAE
jgi:hypothetical protein